MDVISSLWDDIVYWALLLVPCFFWGAYHYYKDRHQPEPVIGLVFSVLLGYLSAYLGLFFYYLLSLAGLNFDAFELARESSFLLFSYSILAIGPIEELAKFIPFIFILSRLPHFDEHLDGMVYASFLALGFSLNENQGYLMVLSGSEAVGRAIASPIVHALFASIWGYAFCFAGHLKMKRSVATMGGLLIAMTLHGTYDFFAIGGSMWATIGPAIIILVIWIWRMRVFHQHTKHFE